MFIFSAFFYKFYQTQMVATIIDRSPVSRRVLNEVDIQERLLELSELLLPHHSSGN